MRVFRKVPLLGGEVGAPAGTPWEEPRERTERRSTADSARTGDIKGKQSGAGTTRPPIQDTSQLCMTSSHHHREMVIAVVPVR